jgi:class 3 adenylate cyclase
MGAAASQGERRQAAVLFADICGYTTLCANNDPEQVQALLGQFYELTDRTVEAYGGHVLDHAGDGVFAVFGAPVAHGNDAERAVRAALEIHAGAAQLSNDSGRPLALHIGIAAGEVVAAVISGGAQPKYSVTGDTVNLAARLDQVAQPGETLVSEPLYRAAARAVAAEALGEITIKGFDKPLAVWKIRRMHPSAAEQRPFVGRHAELRQLSGLLEAVSEHGSSGMAVAVRGETGIGKSRLVAEFRMRAAAPGFACHTGHVLDFGVAKGQDAISVVLKDLLQVCAPSDEPACRRAVDQALQSGLIDIENEAFINDLLDLPQPAALRPIFDAVDSATRSRRTVEAVSEVCKRASNVRPRVLVFEDIHWASAALLRLLAQLTIATAESAIIMVMTTRFEGDPLDKAGAPRRGAAR